MNLKQDDLYPYMSKERAAHSERVAHVATQFAEKYGIDSQKAYTAGLLHDIAKEQNLEKFKAMAITLPEELKRLHQEYPPIWHAFVGKYMVEKLFNITDIDVFTAITHHTTGSDVMSDLDKIIYLSDFLDPKEIYAYTELIEDLTQNNLDEAMLCLTYLTILNLLWKGRDIHSLSVTCYNSFYSKINKSRREELISQSVEKYREHIEIIY